MAGSLLVRLPNWLGDALMARPMLHALRAAQPTTDVVAVGPPALLALLGGERLWDRAVDRADRRWPRADVAVLAPPSFSAAWRAWRSGARVRVGYRGQARDLFLTEALDRPARGEMHLSREYLALAGRVGAHEVPVPLLRTGGGPPAASAPFAILAPGAIYGAAKRWPAERFAELGRALADRGLHVRLCGGESDRAVCDSVAAALPGAEVLAGRTSLGEQAALCEAARLVVSNDSGLAHLAAAVGSPTVAIFGSTSSSWTAPLGPRVRVVQRAPFCAPCFQRTCAIGMLCLQRVGVRAVLTAIDELLAQRRDAA